ncbi:response regulator [Deltaproteobacteria bacterium TL4]
MTTNSNDPLIKILLVDDQPDNLFFLEEALKKENRQFYKALSGVQALEHLKQDLFDLIILDVSMPIMDGFETMSRIQKLEGLNPIPVVIFMTALSKDDDNILKGYQSGASDYLLKPIDIRILRSKVDVFVRLAQQNKLMVRQAEEREQLEKQYTQQLKKANLQLERLLEAIKAISSSKDTFTVLIQASNIIVHELYLGQSVHVDIYFREENNKNEVGYSKFSMKTSPSINEIPVIKLEGIQNTNHSYSRKVPLSLTQAKAGCTVKGKTLQMPIQSEKALLGLIKINSKAPFHLDEKEKHYADTLCQFLAIALGNLGLTYKLERKVEQRTNLLHESMTQLEQQNTTLAASNRKLEDLHTTKTKILEKLRTVQDTHLRQLLETLAELHQLKSKKMGKPLRQITRNAHKLEEALRPITSLYISEQAISNKRVLLAETTKKQQIVAKLALGGTGVKLDIVDTMEAGIRQIEEQHYDIVCANIELIGLCQIAKEKNEKVQTVLMTSENASSYLPILKANPFISNIVSRNEEDRNFTLKNITTTISKLISQDLFGIEKYLNWGVDIIQHPIKGSNEREDLVNKMASHFKDLGLRQSIISKCEIVAEELLMNAIYDAPTDASGKPIYNHLPRTVPVYLSPEEEGTFSYACDGVLLAISTVDPFGALDRGTILDYLQSCYEGKAGSLNEKKGGAGRGLFQMIETADLVVMNVKLKIETEVIVIFNIDQNRAKGDQNTSLHYFYL